MVPRGKQALRLIPLCFLLRVLSQFAFTFDTNVSTTISISTSNQNGSCDRRTRSAHEAPSLSPKTSMNNPEAASRDHGVSVKCGPLLTKTNGFTIRRSYSDRRRGLKMASDSMATRVPLVFPLSVVIPSPSFAAQLSIPSLLAAPTITQVAGSGQTERNQQRSHPHRGWNTSRVSARFFNGSYTYVKLIRLPGAEAVLLGLRDNLRSLLVRSRSPHRIIAPFRILRDNGLLHLWGPPPEIL